MMISIRMSLQVYEEQLGIIIEIWTIHVAGSSTHCGRTVLNTAAFKLGSIKLDFIAHLCGTTASFFEISSTQQINKSQSFSSIQPCRV